MMNRAVLIVAILATPVLALAADSHGGHGDSHAIPMSVGLQAINFALYAALLVFLLRKPIRDYFKGREQAYKMALVKGENARREAEKKKRDVLERLNELESTSDESLQNARTEAAALILQIEQEAELLAKKLREDANRAMEVELEKGRAALRREMLNEAVALSRKMLQDKMAEPDQKRLQTEFVDKIREVHQ